MLDIYQPVIRDMREVQGMMGTYTKPQRAGLEGFPEEQISSLGLMMSEEAKKRVKERGWG